MWGRKGSVSEVNLSGICGGWVAEDECGDDETTDDLIRPFEFFFPLFIFQTTIENE